MTGPTRSAELFNAGKCAYFASMRANRNNTLGLAKAIIDEGGECGVPQGLAAIFGIDPTRDDSRLEKSALVVNNNPLGRLALFDGSHKLHAVGVLSDQPLMTKLDYIYGNGAIHSRRLSVSARFNWAMFWNPSLSEEPELLPDHLNPVRILDIQNDEGSIFESQYDKSAETVKDAATALAMLDKDDENGRKIMGAFFEELIIRSARPAGEPQSAAS